VEPGWGGKERAKGAVDPAKRRVLPDMGKGKKLLRITPSEVPHKDLKRYRRTLTTCTRRKRGDRQAREKNVAQKRRIAIAGGSSGCLIESSLRRFQSRDETGGKLRSM